MITIRDEQPRDVAGIFAMHAAAFPTDAEARLVDALRANGHATISLVAVDDERVVGHVLLSPVIVVDLNNQALVRGLGLAPVAVEAAYRRQGIAARLIEQALALAIAQSQPFVVVLGEPAYYQRFGFLPASGWRVDNQYGAGDAFMLRELQPGSLPTSGGMAKYGPEFAVFG